MNSKGQIIITDLIFYLIIITLILSIVIYSFAMVNDNQVENIEIGNINQVLEDVTETLMTPGTPYNWHEVGQAEQVGLTLNNSSNKISYQKVMRLKENPELLDGYFPEGIKYSICLKPLNKSKEEITIVNSNLGKNVYQKTREVVMDYGYESHLMDDEEYCPLNHTDKYNCNFININKTGLDEGKYYLMSRNTTSYLLSNTYNEIMNISDTELNDNLKHLLHDDSDTICIHVPNKNDTYIVYDKFNQKDNLYSVINPDIYTLCVEVST